MVEKLVCGAGLGNCNNSGEKRNNLEQKEWRCRIKDKGFQLDNRMDTGTIIRYGIQKKGRKKTSKSSIPWRAASRQRK